MAAVRYTWMFRTAAVIYGLLGLSWLGAATITNYRPEIRPYLLGFGALAIATAVMVFRRMKPGIALSAAGAAIVSVSAAVAAPRMHGPGILFLGVLSILTGLYAALAARELFSTAR